tara:strand:- start:233 stop:763 length:531 start_codon:yes stop_codon:yes gene_type:complete
MNIKTTIFLTATITSAIYADYEMSISESEVTLNQGETTQLSVLMNTTDLWFAGDVNVSNSPLISSIEAGSIVSQVPGSSIDFVNSPAGTYGAFAGSFSGSLPGSYELAVINIDSSSLELGQYQIDLFNTALYEPITFLPINLNSLSGATVNIVPAPGALAIGFIGLATSRIKRRRP